ncbi:hypothetical protein DSECCO2_235830 [anaerobic digester metagenome]
MFELLFAARWSPYLAGTGIGLLVCLTLLLSDRPLGASTAFAKLGGMIAGLISHERVESMEYFERVTPAVDWQFLILPGAVIGGLIAALLSGTFAPEFVPSFWAARFGENGVLRFASALVGGLLLGFGARWAGGCTSGHGISGNLQLSIASMLASAGFFIGGILVALALFGIPQDQGIWRLF